MSFKLVVFVLLGLSSSQNIAESCGFVDRYILRKDICSENTDSKESHTTCGYFQKYVFRNSECEDTSDTNYYTKCNFLERHLLRKEYCSYNPDEFLDTPQIIARHGYLSETHTVVTEDGYILKLHRIPRPLKGPKAKKAIFLQHGLMGSSSDWIINGNNSLAFLLADNGYDVWLGNARGNDYSRGHISLPTVHAQYWNFSFDEMGTKDLPAVIGYVNDVIETPGELVYVGHSMGTTMFFVYASMYPEAASKNIKVMAGMANVAYMTHMRSPIRYLAPFSNDLVWLEKYLGFHQFLPNNKILKFLSYQCNLFHVDAEICENAIFAICGFNKEEFNTPILPVLLSKDPAGSSTKTIVHYAQEIRNQGEFQRFDYGPDGNLIQYGTNEPPKYNLTNIIVPVYIMYGMNDWLANTTDVLRLSRKLTHLAGIYKVPMESWNHVDYIFGKDAEQLVYQPLLNFLSKYKH